MEVFSYKGVKNTINKTDIINIFSLNNLETSSSTLVTITLPEQFKVKNCYFNGIVNNHLTFRISGYYEDGIMRIFTTPKSFSLVYDYDENVSLEYDEHEPAELDIYC